EAGGGAETEAVDYLLYDATEIVIDSFDEQDILHHGEILSEDMGVIVDLFAGIDAAGSGVLEAAIGAIVAINHKIENITHAEDTKTILYLFRIEHLNCFNIDFKVCLSEKLSRGHAPYESL
ncbi:unnamed protein product, partial [Sphagnum balticum]